MRTQTGVKLEDCASFSEYRVIYVCGPPVNKMEFQLKSTFVMIKSIVYVEYKYEHMIE